MGQKELIHLAKAGNKEAMINLLKSVENSIFKTAFYFMGNEHDAKDAAQEALMKVYTKLNTFQEKSQFTTWVQRITTNVCMDKFRKNKNEFSFDSTEIILPDNLNIEKKIENKVMVEELIVLIYRLPEKIKAVMILRHFHEFSYQEISDVLNLPLNTVKSYLFRGRDQLQKDFCKEVFKVE